MLCPKDECNALWPWYPIQGTHENKTNKHADIYEILDAGFVRSQRGQLPFNLEHVAAGGLWLNSTFLTHNTRQHFKYPLLIGLWVITSPINPNLYPFQYPRVWIIAIRQSSAPFKYWTSLYIILMHLSIIKHSHLLFWISSSIERLEVCFWFSELKLNDYGVGLLSCLLPSGLNDPRDYTRA